MDKLRIASIGGTAVSLRNYFAGQALAGLLAANAAELLAMHKTTPEEEAPEINATVAEIAFDFADAMIALAKAGAS